jgi:hypothetical protein
VRLLLHVNGDFAHEDHCQHRNVDGARITYDVWLATKDNRAPEVERLNSESTALL